MTIANISILLLFSVICAVASYCYHIDARQEYKVSRNSRLIELVSFAEIKRCIQAAFFLAQLSTLCLFGAAYIAWVSYV